MCLSQEISSVANVSGPASARSDILDMIRAFGQKSTFLKIIFLRDAPNAVWETSLILVSISQI